jgi:metal-responsive CopG/Arc/MetJ family transcriptional regulator
MTMDKRKGKRILVSLPKETWEIIEKKLVGMGDKDSEIVRNIVIAYLSEKGLLLKSER